MARKRPLSPHLSVYKPQITSVLSISHRISGVVNILSLLLVAKIFIFAALGKTSFEWYAGILSSGLVQVILFGFTLGLFYHMCNGIRHLAWDIGKGFELKNAALTGIITISLAILLNLYFWFNVI